MKKAIIIGATSGIGREVALILAKNGYTVGITGRRSDALETLKSNYPNQFITLEIDITKTDVVPSKLNILTQQLGGLDLLFLSSGIGELNANLNFEIESPTIQTNVLGFTCIVNWAYHYFEKQQKGHLVAISSVAGIRGSRIAPAYNASKAYQINYLEGLRQKASNAKLPIVVTEIRAGLVDTAMAKGDGLFWVAPVTKAANQIYRAIQKQQKVVYVTHRWKLIGMALKTLPRFIYAKL